jgi:indole-3-glycerol phosphate synthase
MDLLTKILDRKRLEVARRTRRAACWATEATGSAERLVQTHAALRRQGDGAPKVIAEVKFRSPSAGQIRPRAPGEATRVAIGYARAGAAAISVLCDGPGFGGSPLDLRRVAECVACPVLFKEFVLDPVQLDLARAMGARMVLLLVRALDGPALDRLVEACFARGLAPVVEAADLQELEIALATRATLVGVNARDLRTFRVDPAAAERCIARIPRDRTAIYMSGIASREDFLRVARTRADALLVGEGLMRAPVPGDKLRELIQ